MTSLVAEAVEIVASAGAEIQRVRGGSVETKADRSPVTEADRRADDMLRQGLVGLVSAAWLSEETADDRVRLGSSRVWIVDPLDGTKEFVAGIPEYTVAVALVENGDPVLGIVHNPATEETIVAERGSGAYLNGQRVSVSEGSVLLASRSELKHREFVPFTADWSVRPIGSIQLKLALVAAGVGAITLSRGPKHEWDVAAGALIVEEGGGIATDIDGHALRFNQPFPKTRGILAGAPRAHQRASALIQEIGPSDRMKELTGGNRFV